MAWCYQRLRLNDRNWARTLQGCSWGKQVLTHKWAGNLAGSFPLRICVLYTSSPIAQSQQHWFSHCYCNKSYRTWLHDLWIITYYGSGGTRSTSVPWSHLNRTYRVNMWAEWGEHPRGGKQVWGGLNISVFLMLGQLGPDWMDRWILGNRVERPGVRKFEKHNSRYLNYWAGLHWSKTHYVTMTGNSAPGNRASDESFLNASLKITMWFIVAEVTR